MKIINLEPSFFSTKAKKQLKKKFIYTEYKEEREDFAKLINKIKITDDYHAVIHMASSKVSSQLDFKTHFEENINIAFNLLNLIKNKNLKHFIFTNSAAIYKPGLNLTENSPKSINPYGLSKYLTSNIIRNFCINEKIYFKDLRIFSVFGEWEKSQRLVAGAMESAKNKKFFFIKTSNQLRDYLHTDDVVSAIIKSINIKKNIALNICSGKKITTYELVNKIFDKLSNRNLIKLDTGKYDKKKFFIIPKMTGNNNLAKKILDWKPKNDIEQGINLTIKRKYF